MKRIIILLSIVIIVIVLVAVNYINYKTDYKNIQKYNLEFEENYQKEIYGIHLTTIINKVINNNEKNNVEINQDKKYINNGTNSINIDINELKIVLDDSKEIKVNMDNIYINLYKIYNL